MVRFQHFTPLLLLVVLLNACGGGSATTPAAPTEATSVVAVAATETTAPEPTEAPTAVVLNAQQIVEALSAATVMIRADFPETVVSDAGAGSGTGIVLSDDGYIVTNAHVVEGASAVTVAAAGSSKERAAKLVGVSTCDDLAVLKVSNTEGLQAAPFGESNALKTGEEVVALGYPLGDAIGNDLTVTRGIVSKKETQLDHYESLIQTDTAINPGNSGGPLINTRGEVIGINTLKISDESTSNINFAISIDQARPIIEELRKGTKREWLGMNLVPNDYADYFGVEGGMVVTALDSGSPASRIDVQPADLLTRLEGSDVSSQADVCKILRSHSDGDLLKVELLRLTDAEQQVLQGEIALGDPQASAALELTVVDAQPYAQGGGTASGTGGAQQTASGDEDVDTAVYDFASDDGTWYTGATDGHTAEIANGVYAITLHEPDSYFLSPIDVAEGNEMAIGAKVLVQGDGRGGVALRYNEDESGESKSYYACWIDGGNSYGCIVSQNNQWTTLQEATPSDAILPGQENVVVLSALGDQIVFTVNDQLVQMFTDTSLTTGYPSLYLENFSTEASVLFDNVAVVTPR